MKDDVGQLIPIIERRFCLHLGLKVSIAIEELHESIFRRRKLPFVVGTFVGKVHDLQESGVGKALGDAGKIDHPHVVGGFENESKLQSGDARVDRKLDACEFPCRLQGGNARLRLFAREWTPRL